MGKQSVGILNSYVFLGLFFGSVISSVIFQKVKPSVLVSMACFLNAIVNVLFALLCINYINTTIDEIEEVTFLINISMENRLMVMFMCRMVVGLSQSFVSVYASVWVNANVEEERKGIYMAALQGMLPIGIVVGYVLTVSLALRWYFSFIVQSIFLIIQSVIYLTMPKQLDLDKGKRFDEIMENNHNMNSVNRFHSNNSNYYDENMIHKPRERKHSKLDSFIYSSLYIVDEDREMKYIAEDISKHSDHESSFYEKLQEIMNCKEYICVVFSLSSLYYVVTGIQFNAPSYMEVYLKMDVSLVNTVYTLVILFGLTLGVVVGGLSLDCSGGVTSKSIPFILLFFVLVSYASGIIMVLVTEPQNFVIFISLCLMFGAAYLPGAANYMLEFLTPGTKTLANSLAQSAFNLIGFSPPNIVYGYVNEYYGQNMAMAANMSPGIVGVLALSYLIIYKSYINPKDEIEINKMRDKNNHNEIKEEIKELNEETNEYSNSENEEYKSINKPTKE